MAPTKKSSSKHVVLDGAVERDELALLLHNAMNKSNKDGSKVSYFLDEDDNPSEVVDWVSTGCTLLDLAISNRPNGGLPVGKHVELSGLEGTGKSLISAQLISETQKRGGLSVFFDSEFAVDRNFWAALGVNVKDVPYVPFTTLEELFTKLELCIGEFRKANKNRMLTIFVDSVAQASTETEMESDHGINGYNTGKSIIISKAMRKITGLIAKQRILLVFTNQLRYNMQAGFGQEKWIVPGGKALSFACSVRIRLANLGKLRVGEGDFSQVVGMKVQAQVIKNRCGPNYKTATFEIHYDSGIQNLASWLTFMKLHGMITGTKAKYTYKRLNGDPVEFNTAKFCELMASDPALKSEIYGRICDEYIMKYRNADSAIIEDVQETNTENDDITVNAVPENEDAPVNDE